MRNTFTQVFFLVWLTFSAMLGWNPTSVYANSTGDSTSSPTVHEHDIRNFAPFLYIGAQTQIGHLKYEFDKPNESSHTNYGVDYNSVGFEVGMGLRYKDLGLFVAGGLSELTYWSGTHIVTYTIRENGGIRTYEEGVVTEHRYPRVAYHGTVGLEYRIHLSDQVHCIPFVQGKLRKYKDSRFFPKSVEKDQYYELEDNYSLGGGFTFKGILRDNSSVALRLSFLKNNFNPVGYFENIGAKNLKLTDTTVEISLVYEFDFSGYRIGIFNHRFSFY